MTIPDSKDVSGPLDPQVRIGHVHLKVADLGRALDFYQGVLGFGVTQRVGDSAAFLSAGGYHHHIGLNTWESGGGSSPPPGATGLYHLAILRYGPVPPGDPALRACTTWRSCTRPAPPWPTPCAV